MRVKLPESLIVHPSLPDEDETVEMACLKNCLRKLKSEKLDLLLGYYDTDATGGNLIEARRIIAEKHHKTAGALQKNICVLRKQVGKCARECVASHYSATK